MVDEFYLDLVALRELYILLLKSCLPDANSEHVDERAQILLKHLLDDATARVLEFHSKNIATDTWISYNFLHKENDKQLKPVDKKVLEWIEHNQTARKMINPAKRDSASSNVAANIDLSNGISSALRRIELHILSLQRFTTQSRNSETKLAYCGQSVSKGHNLVGGQKVKPTSHCSEFVHGFRIPLSQDNDEAMKPPTIEAHISNKQHKLVVNLPTPMDKSRLSAGSNATARVVTKLNQTRRQKSYGRLVMRPTLLDHPSREERKEQSHLANQQDSEFTISESESETASSSSSSWATQQTNESEITYDSSSPQHQDSPPETGSDTSSQYRSSSISSKAIKFNRGRKESKRVMGRLKRLKNKLGLIFHHQHHHHHHHHHNSHNNFMWKQLRKIFHGTDKRRLTTSKEGRNGKVKTTGMRSVCRRKNPVGKFQALAEGLVSHVWRSKATKKKKKKKDVRVLNCGKMKKNKLHWWKMFRRRRGVKLPHTKGLLRKPQLNNKV